MAEEDDENRQPEASAIWQRTGDNSLGRLLALSDGVFAIAMTLLALDLQVPNLTGHGTSQQLIHALAQHTDTYWSFILSFYVIAIYWGAHRRLMRSVAVFNQTLVRDTAFLLLIVAALPFPTRARPVRRHRVRAGALRGVQRARPARATPPHA